MIKLSTVEPLLTKSLKDRLYWRDKKNLSDLLPSRFFWGVLEFDLRVLNGRYPDKSLSMSASVMRAVFTQLRRWLFRLAYAEDCAKANRWLIARPDIKKIHDEYVEKTKSTGIPINDYIRLYLYVRIMKPEFVLEFGTGLSTTAIAAGLRDNHAENGKKGVCVSMEDVEGWHKMAKELMPADLSPYIDLRHSSRVVKTAMGLSGVGYAEIPDYKYEMMFVDGPTEVHPETGEKLFDIDPYFVALKNPGIVGLTDHRLNTVKYLKLLLRESHDVVFHPIHDIGYLMPKVKSDK